VKKAADDKEHDLKYEATTEDTDIDEMATKQLAGLRGEGGGYDDYGRFRRMSSKQMTDLVRKNVDAELKRMFPTESQETRDAVGSRIVDHSIGEVNKSVAKASADASRQGISTNEAVYNAMAALIRNTEAKFVEQRRKFEQLGSQLDRRTQGVKVYMSRVRR